MELAPIKENIRQPIDTVTAVPVVKMALSQTPRLPLSDLKQNARPCSAQKTKSRMTLPLHTPTPSGKKHQRKIQPSTLVFEEEKENGKEEVCQADSMGSVSEVSDPTDEKLEEFISDVLQQCVGVIENEKADKNNIMADHLLQENQRNSDNDNQDMIETTQAEEAGTTNFSEPERSIERSVPVKQPDKKVTFNTSLTEEEILLADTSLVDEFGDVSITDSTKSEEELLALTPAGGGTVSASVKSKDEVKSVLFRVKTPKFNFLEKAELTRRVRQASHSLESFLVHKEDMLQDLVWSKNRLVNKPETCDAEVSTDPTELLNKSVNTEHFTPERKPCHSISCSPMPLFQLDAGVQNVVDVESVSCSPIPIPCSDASTQKYPEVQSVLCSPIHIPGIDTSTQAGVETRSVECTPIRIPMMDTSVQHVAEMHSFSCSPMQFSGMDVSTQNEIETQSVTCSPMVPRPNQDVSTQNEIETQSVTCSPMVPRPSQDKSILVSGPELVDLCVGTDVTETKDEGVNVQPDTMTSSTEMDDLPMISCGTAMTPLKLVHKQGRKLTADDIRKQHPRVLANELETLKSLNQRLETRVHSLEQDNKKVAHQEELLIDLQLTRTMLEDERDLYWKQFGEWKTKSEDLEKHNEMLRLTHEQEISDLKEKYEASDYYGHFLASQNLVSELQAELQQYKELLPDMEHSQTLMEDLKKQYSSNFTKLKTASKILNDRKEEVERKEIEVTRRTAECEVKEEKNNSIDKEREELTSTLSALQDRVTEMEADIHKKDSELNKLTVSNKDMQSQLGAIVILQRTLDNRDSEIDLLEKDLFECREVICTQIEERNKLGAQLEETTAMLNGSQKEVNDLKDCLVKLRGIQQGTRETLSCVQEELSGTKEYASRLIKEQGTEITECSDTIGQLADHMTSILEGLRRKAGIQDDKEEDTEEPQFKLPEPQEKSKPKSKRKFKSRPSFVSQILKAVGDEEEDEFEQDGNNGKETGVETDGASQKDGEPTTQGNVEANNLSHHSNTLHTAKEISDTSTCSTDSTSRKKLLFSSTNSAFAPVKTVTKPVCATNDIQTIEPSVVSANSKSVGDSKKTDCGEKRKVEDVDNVSRDEKLSSQIAGISEKFELVVHVAQLIEKALRSSLQDIRTENYDLQREISQSEYSEKRITAQLELTQKELESCRKQVKQQQMDIQELSDRYEGMLDRQSEGQKQALEREVKLLRSKIHSLEGEREVLNDQLNEILQKAESEGREKAINVDAHAQKEIIILKKKLDKCRLSLIEKDELLGNERSKASKQILKMEDNWKQADAEIVRLYELIDKVRTRVLKSKNYSEDANLQKVVRALDGLETNATSVLKPMKTSRW